MAEKVGQVSAHRDSHDTLMGVFGTPDTGNTIAQAFTGTAAANTNLKVHKWYRFIATEDCHVHIAASGDATTSHMFMKAGVPEVFYSGQYTRFSVIQNSAAGTLFVTPLMTNDRETT